MLIKTEELKVISKGRLKGVSSKTNKEYNLPQIQTQAKDNVSYILTLPNEFLFEMATEGETIKIIYYIDTKGNVSINNIERVNIK